MTTKIAIIGSQGYVGSNLLARLEHLYDVTGFSHTSNSKYSRENLMLGTHYSLASLPENIQNFNCAIFLLESKAQDDREFIKEYLESLLSISGSTKIIIFSTMSVFSQFHSEYVKFKLSLESIAAKFDNAIIIRPGIIYGGIPGGLYKKLVSFKKKKFLLVPCGNSVTGYTHIETISKQIELVVELKKNQKIQTVLDAPLSLAESIYFFGFRGHMLVIPSALLRIIFFTLLPIIKYLPQSLQSLSTLSAIKLPDIATANEKNNRLIFRRILLLALYRHNNSIQLKFGIRNFIRTIASNNELSKYLSLSGAERFIFLKRLFEIYNLSTDK